MDKIYSAEIKDKIENKKGKSGANNKSNNSNLSHTKKIKENG